MLGIATTVVKPPAAAAAVPVAMVSFQVWPGSRRWTWMSMRPGAAIRLVASMVSAASILVKAPAGSRADMRPFWMWMSLGASRLVAGSMVRALRYFFSFLHFMIL